MENHIHKPKLILHIGHGKTGTTSIQDFLAANHQQLLRLGYLYPVRHSPRSNHVVIRGCFMKPEDMGVHGYQVYAGDTDWFQRDSNKFLKSMCDDIQDKTPHTVILSAEQMFRDFSKTSKTSLKKFFGEYFSEVLVVAYIKSPMTSFFSSISQSIRVGKGNISPKHREIKRVINYYQGQFPGCIKLNAFEKNQLIKEDVVIDFLTKYVPELLGLIEVKKAKRSNVSLSWPLLLLLRKLRMQVQPEGNKPLRQTRMMLARVSRQFQKNKNYQSEKKPKLKKKASDYLVRYAHDYLWLKKEYGVVFSDLNYELINAKQSKPDMNLRFTDLEDLFDLSEIPVFKADIGWYSSKGNAYYLFYMVFLLRMRVKRLISLHLRKALSWMNSI